MRPARRAAPRPRARGRGCPAPRRRAAWCGRGHRPTAGTRTSPCRAAGSVSTGRLTTPPRYSGEEGLRDRRRRRRSPRPAAALRRWSRCRWRCRRPRGCARWRRRRSTSLSRPSTSGRPNSTPPCLSCSASMRRRQAVGVGEDDVEHGRHRAHLGQPVDELGERRPRPGPLAERVDRGLVDVDDHDRRAGRRARRDALVAVEDEEASAGRAQGVAARRRRARRTSTARPTIQTARPRRRADCDDADRRARRCGLQLSRQGTFSPMRMPVAPQVPSSMRRSCP